MHGLRESILRVCVATALIAVGSLSVSAEQDAAKVPVAASTSFTLNPAARNLPMEVQGDLLMNHGSYAAAIVAYQKAWPRSAALWNKTGLAYHHLFALDEAMKDYQLAIVLDPHYAEAYNNLGAVYHGKREFGMAERMYKRALKYQPRSAVTYCNLGTTYFAESKYKQGVKAYRKAMQVDPEVFHVNHMEQVETASSRAERMAMAYNLAKLYASEGRNDDAMEALQKALSEGFNDRKRLLSDREFATLRETPEFRKLLVEEHLN
jgi:tetratricopeptide (TPR) repeat protein